jgi:Sulfotransferase family
VGAHPDAVTVGELKVTNLGNVQRYRCSCGRLIEECCFWRRVREAMTTRGHQFDLARPNMHVLDVKNRYAARLLRPLHRGVLMETLRDWALGASSAWRQHLAETQRRNLAFIQALGSVTGAPVVVDSSKLALRLKYLLRIAPLDVRVLRLIRDGRAVAMTYLNPQEFADATDESRRGGGSGITAPPRRELTMREAAREWRRSNEEAETVLRNFPQCKWLEVRYEDLCQAPAATLRNVATFLGLEPNKIVLDFRSRDHHVIGNGMRFDTTSNVRLDDRWKTTLTADQLHVFDTVAGDLNRRYGYQ